jgi:hypothetical protein
MKSITIVNNRLAEILDNFKKDIFLKKESYFIKEEINEEEKVRACSKEYLDDVKDKMIGRTHDCKTSNVDQYQEALKLNADLAEWDNHQGYIVSQRGVASLRYEKFSKNALATIYPKNGYMAWHNNNDAPGHNVLFTWTENGQGFFRYQDPETKEIVTMNDKPGWTCKVGYFASRNEMDKIFWHCCSADEIRITVAWIFPTLQARNDFINQVQQP